MFARPNWRDAAQYSKFLEVRTDLLAWEFIRRNAAYQDDASRCFANPSEGEDFDFSSRWRAYFFQRWGLHTPKHPGDDYYPTEFDQFPIFAIDDFRTFTHFNDWQPNSGPKVLLPIDLSMPLEAIQEQLMGAAKALRCAGVENGSIKPASARTLPASVYVEHLRILDGTEAGATIAEIGAVLRPGAINDPEAKQRDKRTRAAHKAALKMQAEGWRVLWRVANGVPD